MKHFLLATTLLLAAFRLSLTAQTKKDLITGKVISFEESFPLEGAGIVVKGTKNTTGTQVDGTFSLTISTDDKILVISLNGYEKQEVKITSERDYNVVLRRKD